MPVQITHQFIWFDIQFLFNLLNFYFITTILLFLWLNVINYLWLFYLFLVKLDLHELVKLFEWFNCFVIFHEIKQHVNLFFTKIGIFDKIVNVKSHFKVFSILNKLINYYFAGQFKITEIKQYLVFIIDIILLVDKNMTESNKLILILLFITSNDSFSTSSS